MITKWKATFGAIVVCVVIFTTFALYSAPSIFADDSHAHMACTICHLTEPEFGVDTPETVDYVKGTILELCLSCHPHYTYIHRGDYCESGIISSCPG